jgi:hypothetical protein
VCSDTEALVTMKYLMFLILLIHFISCSSTQRTLEKQSIKISVTHLSGSQNEWQIEYKFPNPIHRATFRGPKNQQRRSNFEMLSKNSRFCEMNGKDSICSINQEPFQSVLLRVKSVGFLNLLGDYNMFHAFSDGSSLMYTGFFNIYPGELSDISTDDFYFDFIFKTQKQEQITMVTKTSSNNNTWRDDTKKGTYVYWGNINKIETRDLFLVIDPGLPEWIKKSTKEKLPKLLRYFKKKANATLSFKPLVFLSYQDGDKLYANIDSTRLPGLIQININGIRWQQRKNHETKFFLYRLADESASFWNSKLYNYKVAKDTWMHRGAIESFSTRSLLDLNFISEKRYLKMYNNWIETCTLGIHHMSLQDSHKKNKALSYYTCGAIIGLISEKMIQKVDPDATIFTLWNEIFKAAHKNNNIYNKEIYLNTLGSLTKHSPVINDLNDLITKKSNDISKDMHSMFRKVGLDSKLLRTNSSERYKRQCGIDIANILMDGDCGSINILHNNKYFEFHGSKQCRTIKRRLKVNKIEKWDIIKDGVKAYDFAKKSCMDKKMVTLKTIDGQSIKLDCKEIPVRRLPLKFTSL